MFISNNFDLKLIEFDGASVLLYFSLDKMYTRKPPSVNKTRFSDHLEIRFNFTVNDFTPICELITELDFINDFDLTTEFWRFP